MWYWQKNRKKDQWNRPESQEIDPRKYSQQIFDEGVKAINGVKIVFVTGSSGRHSHAENESRYKPFRHVSGPVG